MAAIGPLAARAARQAGVPPRLYVALITHGERSYKGWQTSPAGAQGPAQLMPGTAAALAARHGIDPSTPYGNLLGGAYYLREQLDRFKNPRLAVAAYNAGPGAVAEHGGVPPYAETQRYVRNVFSGLQKTRLPLAELHPPVQAPAALTSLAQAQPGLDAQIFQNLGQIAMGQATPLQTLGDLTASLQSAPGLDPQPLPAPVTIDDRGHLTTKAMRTPDPGGGWGGSQHPATVLAHVGLRDGLSVSSTKRDRKLTTSGNPSDHWVGSKNAFAYDLTGSVEQMDKAARDLAHRLGIRYTGGPLVVTKTVRGLRYQLLYRTHIGGNHFTHVHVGVKRVG